MGTMINSTVPRTSQRSVPRLKDQDPESQSTAQMLSQTTTTTDRSSIHNVTSTPEEQEAERKRNTYSGLPGILDFFWGGVYTPGASTHDPIEILLNTEDPDERDRLTELWRDNRLNELSFVGVVVSAVLLRDHHTFETILIATLVSLVGNSWFKFSTLGACTIWIFQMCVMHLRTQYLEFCSCIQRRHGPFDPPFSTSQKFTHH